MNRLLRDLEPGNDLMIRINRNRGFQEAFPGFSGPPGIIRAGIKRVNLYESRAVLGILSPRY